MTEKLTSRCLEFTQVSSKNGITSDSTSSNQYAASSIKGETGQEYVAGQDVDNPPTSYYDYYYPGQNFANLSFVKRFGVLSFLF